MNKRHKKAKAQLMYDLSLIFLTTGVVLFSDFISRLVYDVTGFKYYYFITFVLPILGFILLYREADKINE